MKNLVCLPFLLITITAFSQTEEATVKFINPSAMSSPKGYSHAVSVDLGNCYMLILSGQVALDSTGNLVGKDNVEKQTEQVFLNIKTLVEQAGGTMDNLVKLGYYITDVAQIQTIRTVRDKFINVKHPPASTLVQVSKLFRSDVLIEIEATAIIPKR